MTDSQEQPAEVSLPTEIVVRSVDSLMPYATNSRTHSNEQIDQIAASIREFGFTNPVLTSGDTIVAGHGRVVAAERLGLVEIPTIDLSHLSPEQVKAYVIADNQLALNAGWDIELLAIDVADLRSADFDVELLGFDDSMMTSIFLDREDGETDPYNEWEGMPEYQQEDQRAFRSLRVHFASQKDIDDFQKLVELKITDKTKYIWFPRTEIAHFADKQYE